MLIKSPRLIRFMALSSLFLTGSTTSLFCYAEKTLNLNEHKGKVVYLDFWASWCGPCRLSFPFMETLQKSYGSKGLDVVTINLDADTQSAEKFLTELHSRLPVIFDPNGKLAEQFNVEDMPTSIIIDREGQIKFVHQGFHEAKTDEYIEHIQTLLSH